MAEINHEIKSDQIVKIETQAEPDECIVDMEEEINDIDKLKDKKKQMTKKKIGMFLFCYGLSIFLLSFNISATMNHVQSASNFVLEKKNSTCEINEYAKIITLKCPSNSKVFSLGQNFDFSLCAFSSDYHNVARSPYGKPKS